MFGEMGESGRGSGLWSLDEYYDLIQTHHQSSTIQIHIHEVGVLSLKGMYMLSYASRGLMGSWASCLL